MIPPISWTEQEDLNSNVNLEKFAVLLWNESVRLTNKIKQHFASIAKEERGDGDNQPSLSAISPSEIILKRIVAECKYLSGCLEASW